MSDEIQRGIGITVQDLANETKVFRSALHNQPPGAHADLWGRHAKRLWSKAFAYSNAGERREHPPVPDDLAQELARLAAWEGAIEVVARARATVSGLSADVERSGVKDHADRHLQTDEGQERQADLDKHPTP